MHAPQKVRSRAKDRGGGGGGDAEMADEVRAAEAERDVAAAKLTEVLQEARTNASLELLQAIYTTVIVVVIYICLCNACVMCATYMSGINLTRCREVLHSRVRYIWMHAYIHVRMHTCLSNMAHFSVFRFDGHSHLLNRSAVTQSIYLCACNLCIHVYCMFVCVIYLYASFYEMFHGFSQHRAHLSALSQSLEAFESSKSLLVK
jgi:hypothetical protein